MGNIRQLILIFMIVMSVPQDAFAGWSTLACDDEGHVATGELYDGKLPDDWATTDADNKSDCQGDCQHTSIRHIFSNVFYDFLGVVNTVLGKVYCGIQFSLIKALRVLLTIYVAVFGFQMLMGTAQVNTREVMIRLLKIVLVWLFATESTYALNILFNGALAFINDVSYWVLNALAPELDKITMGGGHCTLSHFEEGDYELPIFGFLDCILYYAFTGAKQAESVKLMGFFAVMMTVYPPLPGLVYYWAIKTFFLMARTVINLLMALTAIAFLVALTPIFFSLALFHFTSHFFDNWLRYMAAYVIQMVMAFVVIVMWILVFGQFTVFFNDLSGIVFENVPVLREGAQIAPSKSWGICPPAYAAEDLLPPVDEDPDAHVPFVQCKDANFNPFPSDTNANWKMSAEKIILPSAIIEDPQFIYFVFYHLIGLIIITYCFGVILDQVPSISASIAGPVALPQILGGGGMQNFGGGGFGGNQRNTKPQSVGSVALNASTSAAGETGLR